MKEIQLCMLEAVDSNRAIRSIHNTLHDHASNYMYMHSPGLCSHVHLTSAMIYMLQEVTE